MRKISNIILHCSDSVWGNVREIDKWHKARGWSGIGYHFVILNGNVDGDTATDFRFLDGSIECGRALNDDNILSDNEIGAHAFGFNATSVAICLIGKDSRFTTKQMQTLLSMLAELVKKWGLTESAILGHYEVDRGKTCPNLDMVRLRNDVYRHLIRQVL